MPGIPAASIRGIDLELLARKFPEQVQQIDRLGKLMIAGEESEDEFLRLCQLLYDVGETSKSEELLRANAEEGNGIHNLYIKLHGMNAEHQFLNAARQFSFQFGVDLSRVRSPRYLDVIYSCQARHIPQELPVGFSSLLLSRPDVEIAYYSSDEIVADVFGRGSEIDDAATVPACPLTFENGIWILQSGPVRFV